MLEQLLDNVAVEDNFDKINLAIDKTNELTLSAPSAVLNLELPVYDNNQNGIHVDVLKSDTKIFGYKYWMAHTPYPSSSRELPSVCASHDGVKWEIPDGAPNPLVDGWGEVAASYRVLGDTDIVYQPDGVLAVYFIVTEPGVGNTVFRMTSSDGVVWSTPASLFTETVGLDASISSPSAVVENDDSMSLYYTSLSGGGARQVIRRTSAIGDNGATWGSRVEITTPNDEPNWFPWHGDVLFDGTTYHMLMACGIPGLTHFMQYWTSADGLTFTGLEFSSRPGILPDIGDPYMTGVYRSSIAISEEGNFDVWLAGRDELNIDIAGTNMRYHLLRNLKLDGNDAIPPSAMSYGGQSKDSLRHQFAVRSIVLESDYVVTNDATLNIIPLDSRTGHSEGGQDVNVGAEGIYLGYAVEAGQPFSYSFKGRLLDGSSTDNYKFEMGTAHGGVMSDNLALVTLGKIGTSTVFNWTTASSIVVGGFVGNGAEHMVTIEGTAEFSTSGTFVIKFAQGTSNALPVTLKRGATLTINRIVR